MSDLDEAQVDRVAQALRANWASSMQSWEETSDASRESWRSHARAAIAAMHPEGREPEPTADADVMKVAMAAARKAAQPPRRTDPLAQSVKAALVAVGALGHRAAASPTAGDPGRTVTMSVLDASQVRSTIAFLHSVIRSGEGSTNAVADEVAAAFAIIDNAYGSVAAAPLPTAGDPAPRGDLLAKLRSTIRAFKLQAQTTSGPDYADRVIVAAEAVVAAHVAVAALPAKWREALAAATYDCDHLRECADELEAALEVEMQRCGA